MTLFVKNERKNKKTKRDEINALIDSSKKWGYVDEKFNYPLKRKQGEFLILGYYRDVYDTVCYALDLSGGGTFSSKLCILNSVYWRRQSDEMLKKLQGTKVRFADGKIYFEHISKIKRAEKLNDMVLSYKQTATSLTELRILRNMYDNAYALVNEEINIYADYLNDDTALAMLKERNVDLKTLPLSSFIEKWNVVLDNYYEEVMEKAKLKEKIKEEKIKQQVQKMRDEMV